MAAVSQAIMSRKSTSLRLTYGRSRSIEPSLAGTGNGNSPSGRRNWTPGRSISDHPSALI